MNEDIKEMLFKLKRQNTFEDIGYFKTALSNEDVDLLLNYIEQLQNNWNELKKYAKEHLYFYSGYQGEDLEEDLSIKYLLDKMQELEQVK